MADINLSTTTILWNESCCLIQSHIHVFKFIFGCIGIQIFPLRKNAVMQYTNFPILSDFIAHPKGLTIVGLFDTHTCAPLSIARYRSICFSTSMQFDFLIADLLLGACADRQMDPLTVTRNPSLIPWSRNSRSLPHFSSCFQTS